MYKVFVTKIKIEDIGANSVNLGHCAGYQVICNKNISDGDFVVFFPSDGQLDKDFALRNGLFRKHPDTDEPLEGYLEKNARIRQIKLMKYNSDGIVLPISAFDYIKGAVKFLKSIEGKTFDGNICGHQIAQKYETPATKNAREKNSKKYVPKIKKQIHFPKHWDTDQWKVVSEKDIQKGDIVYISEKLHGSSQRVTLAYVEYPLPKWKRVLNKFGFKFKPEEKLEVVTGSRNVVINSEDGGFYGCNRFRFETTEKFKDYLIPGEVVYGEIVGWVNEHRTIMEKHNIEKLKDKKLLKKYGKNITYSYGCKEGEHKFFVYRISRVNRDGIETDLSWQQVKCRAKEMGLDTTPDLCYAKVIDDDFTLEDLKELVSELENGPSTLDHRHIREGVCIRVEGQNGIKIFKAKSFNFGVMEGYLKMDNDYVDMEEIG